MSNLSDESDELCIVQMLDQTEQLAAEEALQALNQELEFRVKARTAELRQTLSSLKETQEALIQTETLASLGSLAANVSHELNTPLGNIMMATSTLEAGFDELQHSVDNGELKRSLLSSFIEQGRQMSQLAFRSSQRCAELTDRFKQSAIDQLSEKRTTFNLRLAIDESIRELRENLRSEAIELSVTIPENIVCDSYAEPLGQVIAELLQNAMIHASNGTNRTTICINAVISGSLVNISVIDSGLGMSGHTLAHIFDPLFTSKLGKRGGGMGLSLCKQIVHAVLGGDLRAESTLGFGSSFFMTFPSVAPGKI
jgi:signal transduction histidine kinase